MRVRITNALLLMMFVSSYSFAQSVTAATAPRVIVALPDNIPTESIWVRYALYGPEGNGGRISSGATLKTLPKSPHYEILGVSGATPTQHAKIVIYAPTCEFAVYDVDLSSGSAVSVRFQCVPLPVKTVHGFLHPSEIPNTHMAEKKLDVTGYLDGNWVCDFFSQQRRGATMIEVGSCLSSAIPLGTVGQIDPARGGSFEITIPDFTRDPTFDRFTRNGRFGVIQLGLDDKVIGRGLGAIKAADSSESGLNVQVEYREPTIFTRVRPR